MKDCDSLGMFINIASMEIRRNLDATFAEYGCTSGIQGRVLGLLADAQQKQECIYQKDIEKYFGTRRSSVNNLISNLEQRGLVERIPDPTDARLKKLRLTEPGVEQHAKIVNVLETFECSLTQNFTPEEKELFLELLKRVISYFHSDSEHATIEKEDFHA